MMIDKSNFDLLPGGGNGFKPCVLSGGAIGRSNFGSMGGAESRGGAIGEVMGAEGN